MTGRWTLHRAGIVNVYQYGDEVLHFAGGRLLLRGVNGSGKSTAMNMLLPFLLDADTRRIDAAGEQSSVLRSWMLSGRDDPQPSGYLWIEFRRPREASDAGADGDADPGADYLVCGCGIRANRSTERVTTWWFVTDRRPGIDLALVENRVPLSVDALRAGLGAHAVFAQEQRAGYRAEVRGRLFGGADIDQHIRLLHVVRNPRVGDRIDVELPTHLDGALPQLSDAALDDAAQPLEDLEEHRRNVEELAKTADTLTALGATYRDYARSELRRRSDDVLQRFEQVRADRRRRDETEAAATAASEALQTAEHTLQQAKADRNRLQVEIEALLAQPAYREGQQLDDLRSLVRSLTAAVTNAERAVQAAAQRHDDAVQGASLAEVTLQEDVERLARDLSDLSGAARAVGLPLPGDVPDVVADVEFDPNAMQAGLGSIRAGTRIRLNDVGELYRRLDQVDAQAAEVRSAEGHADRARQDVDGATRRFDDARAGLDAAVEHWRGALLHWVDRLDALELTPPDGGTTPDAAGQPADRSLFDGAALLGRRREVTAVLDEMVTAHIETQQAWLVWLGTRRRVEETLFAERRARLNELLERAELRPPAQGWQRPERSITLAECLDFADGLEAIQRAALEAAMEAAGLLGAEVSPDATLRLADGELLVTAAAPVAAPLSTLLRVTIPAGRPQAPDHDTVLAILESISTDPGGDDPAAVAADGSFRIGALRGAHAKPTAEHIGVTARLAALERARREAREALTQATAQRERTDATIAIHEERLDAARKLRRERPAEADVAAAAQQADLAEQRLADARDRVATCVEALRTAEEVHAGLAADALREAVSLDLPAARDGLRQLETALGEISGLCDRVQSRLEALSRSHRQRSVAIERARRSEVDVGMARHDATLRRAEHEEQAMRLATLEDSVGAEYAELLASLELARRDKDDADRRLEVAENGLTAAVTENTATAGRAAAADRDAARSEAACTATLRPLRATLALPGLLTAALPPPPAPDGYADTDTDANAPTDGESGQPAPHAGGAGAIGANRGTGEEANGEGNEPAVVGALRAPVSDNADGARALARAVLAAVPEAERNGITAEGVRQSLRQRRDQLGAGWDAEDHQPDETQPLTIEVTGPLVGSRIALVDAAGAVRLQLQRQSSLLTAKQDQALRNLLQGLIAREVSDKMHAAGELVKLMNKRLATVTTSHGIGATLRWRRRDDLDDDLAATIDLLAKPPDLRTVDEDRTLAAALSARIDRARRADPEVAYRALVGEVLDYRAWHTMAVLILRPGEAPKVLSRRTALSEGEKKLVSYLPLFAAVAASCDSLAQHSRSAPRFVLLDDAFAKVSEDNHARLFGLLVQLDLDFIATSERLWGTHPTVPELAITEVLRDAELNVIVLEHSRWNGAALAAGPGT